MTGLDDGGDRRHAQTAAEAIRARRYSAEETLAMGLSLIDFAVRFNREVKDAVHG